MDTPAQKILRLLKSTPDALSGEQIAQELGVTHSRVEDHRLSPETGICH